jgi:hypothetical protein
VTLPTGIPAANIQHEGYTGPQGSRGQSFTSSIGGDTTVSFVSTEPLPPGEGLTVVVSWPKGYVQEPNAETRFRYFIDDNGSILAGAAGLTLVLLYYIVVWLRVGRDPDKPSIMPNYEPPAGVSPAAMRYLVRMGFDDKTLTAAVIDMAVKKFLSIKENDGAYTLHRSSGDQKALSPEERAAGAKLFGKSNSDDDDSDDRRRKVVSLKPNNGALRDAVTALRKTLHTQEDKIYFNVNQGCLIPGVILSVGVIVAMATMETGDRRFVLGFFSAWLSGWSVAVFFLVRQASRLWKVARADGSVGARSQESGARQHIVRPSICCRRNRRSLRVGRDDISLGAVDPERTGRHESPISLVAKGTHPRRTRPFKQN